MTEKDSSVCIVIGYRLGDWDSISDRGKRFYSSPQYPEGLWSPLILLSNGYSVFLLR
jgi:hypothetical protein